MLVCPLSCHDSIPHAFCCDQSLRFALCHLRGCGFSMPSMWLFYTSVSPSTASYSGDEAWWDQPALMREIRCSPASAPAPASRIARFELWQCGGAERINSMPSLSKRITCMRLLCRTGERRSTGTSAPSHQFRLLAIGVFVLLETPRN